MKSCMSNIESMIGGKDIDEGKAACSSLLFPAHDSIHHYHVTFPFFLQLAVHVLEKLSMIVGIQKKRTRHVRTVPSSHVEKAEMHRLRLAASQLHRVVYIHAIHAHSRNAHHDEPRFSLRRHVVHPQSHPAPSQGSRTVPIRAKTEHEYNRSSNEPQSQQTGGVSPACHSWSTDSPGRGRGIIGTDSSASCNAVLQCWSQGVCECKPSGIDRPIRASER